jgi:hypothetical protein
MSKNKDCNCEKDINNRLRSIHYFMEMIGKKIESGEFRTQSMQNIMKIREHNSAAKEYFIATIFLYVGISIVTTISIACFMHWDIRGGTCASTLVVFALAALIWCIKRKRWHTREAEVLDAMEA